MKKDTVPSKTLADHYTDAQQQIYTQLSNHFQYTELKFIELHM